MNRIVQTLMLSAAVTISMGAGCSNKKEIVEEVIDEVSEVVSEDEVGSNNADFTFGKVTKAFEEDGCPYLIMLKQPLESGEKFLLPIGLDEEYLVHDMQLKFEWITSRAPSGNCYRGQPAILSNVRSL